jgi:TonB family protein
MPVYPAALRQQGVSGKVTLELTIAKHGRVVQADFVSGERKLTEVSGNAVKTWKFNPYLLNGQPVEVTGLITFEYQPDTGRVRFSTVSPEVQKVKTP